jgi:hypothetical protein
MTIGLAGGPAPPRRLLRATTSAAVGGVFADQQHDRIRDEHASALANE